MSRYAGSGLINRFSEYSTQGNSIRRRLVDMPPEPSMQAPTGAQVGAAAQQANIGQQIGYNQSWNRLQQNPQAMQAAREGAYNQFAAQAQSDIGKHDSMSDWYKTSGAADRAQRIIAQGPSAIPLDQVRSYASPQLTQQAQTMNQPMANNAALTRTAFMANTSVPQIQSEQAQLEANKAGMANQTNIANAEIGNLNSRTATEDERRRQMIANGPIQNFENMATAPARIIGAYRQAFSPTQKPQGYYQAEASKYAADKRLEGQKYASDARSEGTANTDQMRAMQEHLKFLQDYIRKNHKGAVTPELEKILSMGQAQNQTMAQSKDTPNVGESRVLPDGSSATFDGMNWIRNKGY